MAHSHSRVIRELCAGQPRDLPVGRHVARSRTGAGEWRLEATSQLRHLKSAHLALVTDLPEGNDVNALPALFDQAFGQWCEYFAVDPECASRLDGAWARR